MIIKNLANVRFCKIIGASIWFVSICAGNIIGMSSGLGWMMSGFVFIYGSIGFIASALVSTLFYRFSALEAVLLAFAMLLTVDLGGLTLGSFSSLASVEFVNSISLGMVLSLLLGQAVVGSTILGVSMVSRQSI